MNRWAANNPELYEQLGHEGYIDHFRDRADMERKRQKEEGDPCRVCGEVLTLGGAPCKRCERSMEWDRLERERAVNHEQLERLAEVGLRLQGGTDVDLELAKRLIYEDRDPETIAVEVRNAAMSREAERAGAARRARPWWRR